MDLDFEEIKMEVETLTEEDRREFIDIKSDIYYAEIKQAYLLNAQNSQSKAINFTLKLLSKEKKLVSESQDVSVWFIGRDGNMSSYGSSLICALLAICELPTQIDSSCFTQGNIVKKAYNKNKGSYEDVLESGAIFQSLMGKKIGVVLGVEYEIYNGNLKKKINVNSFYDIKFRSLSEIKDKKEAGKKWMSRVEYCAEKEQRTQTDCNNKMSSVDYSSGSTDYQDANYQSSYTPPSYSQDTKEPTMQFGDEEIPF